MTDGLEKKREKPAAGGKHIKFTSDVTETEKEQISTRATRNSKMPKHDQEVEMFKTETLEQIRIFRAARKEWLLSMADTEVGTKAVDKTLHPLEIDRRRINAMKKLGLKVSMMRPHRKTLRPKVYFTFKRALTQRDLVLAEAELEAKNAALNEKTKLVLMKDFRKMAKKATNRMVKLNKVPPEDGKKQEVTSGRQKDIPLEEDSAKGQTKKDAAEVTVDEDNFAFRKETTKKSETEDSAISGIPEKKHGVKDEKRAEEQEGRLSSASMEEFNKIIRKLKSSPHHSLRPITNEDVDEMMTIWRQLHSPTSKEEISLDTWETTPRYSPNFKKVFNLVKNRRLPKPKTKSKPCKCQFVDGEGVIILKNVCNCSNKLAKAVIVGPEVAGQADRKISVDTDESDILFKPSFNLEKIVDSLELIRKKLRTKSPPASKSDPESYAAVDTTEINISTKETPSRHLALTISAPEDHSSRESIPDNVKPVKLVKSKPSLSRKSRASGARSSSKVRKKEKPKSILGKRKKCKKKSKNPCHHVSFQENVLRTEVHPKEGTSSKITKTVMSVVNIFRRNS